jgi:hypothetical protein
MEHRMKTLTDFIASRETCADIGERIGADLDGVHSGFVYAGDCYIEQEPDGSFYLMLHRDEYRSTNITELEAILYSWALSELPDEMELPDDVHAFVCELQGCIGDENFAKALLANMAEPDAYICHFHDYCDANQCALNVAHDEVDAAIELYTKARPALRGKTESENQK